MEKIPIMRLCGEYVPLYRPAPDIYNGLDTRKFRNGTLYESWTVNDFSVLQDGNQFHMVGITHPTPPDFVDEFTPVAGDLHEGEHVLFHATATGKTFADLMHPDSFCDLGKLLWPQERPDEIPEIHAPHLLRGYGHRFRLIYGPHSLRMAETDDFLHYTRRTLFNDHKTARDPYLFWDDGLFYLIYAVENRVDYRVSASPSLEEFSPPRTLQINPFSNEAGVPAASESPFLFRRKGFYYLMWAIYDGRAGTYDHRTYVFGARTLEGLACSAPLTMLPAHAAEIYSDESGDYLLSAFYPENGISAAPLAFDD